MVVATYEDFFADPTRMLRYGSELKTYLRRNFRPAFSVGNHLHMVLVPRKEPLEDKPSRDLWPMCDVRPGGVPATFMHEHLLFRSLYHWFQKAWATHNQALTKCQFEVPADARLRLGLELYQPAPADGPGAARAEIWLFQDRGRPRRLLTQQWPLATESDSIHKAGREFEIDLSRWNGKVVNLLLRSVVDGKVPPPTFDDLGFSVMWNGARLESPDYETGTGK